MTDETKQVIEIADGMIAELRHFAREGRLGETSRREADALESLIQLVKDYEEAWELLALIDRADFQGDFYIERFNEKFRAVEYDEDGALLKDTDYFPSPLEAYRTLRDGGGK